MKTQLTRGLKRRLMYIENKSGHLDGADARVGFVTFSRTGMTVYYRGRELQKIKGRGVSGNYHDVVTGHEYWVSGVKKRGSNVHSAGSATVIIDDDALSDYRKARQIGS